MNLNNSTGQHSSLLSILLIELEFSKWKLGRHWTYLNQLGFEEGLESQNVNYFTVTTPWVPKIRDICHGKKFDQVWLEIVHQEFDDSFWQWLTDVAPLRVGFIAESLEYGPEAIKLNSRLKERKDKVYQCFSHLTHIVAQDEKDVDDINYHTVLKAMWWPPAVPQRFIKNGKQKNHAKGPAIFSGAIYGQRERFLENPQLKGLLVHQKCPDGKLFPFLFDALHFFAKIILKLRLPFVRVFFKFYLYLLRWIRKMCFRNWLKSMTAGCAVVNLPHLFGAYPGRVFEGMMVDCPVISWRIPERPRSEALFKHNEEILFFDNDETSKLAAHIKKIQSQPDLVRTLTENARKKLIQHHTIEKRTEQILNWIKTGEDPSFD